MCIQDSKEIIGRVSKVPEVGSRMRSKAQVGGVVFQKTVKQLTFRGPIKVLVDPWMDVLFISQMFNFSWLTNRLERPISDLCLGICRRKCVKAHLQSDGHVS